MGRRRILGAMMCAALALGADLAPPVAASDRETGTERPGAPRDVVAINLMDGTSWVAWQRATDDTGIAEYVVLRNGVEIARTDGDARDLVLEALPHGVSFLQLQAIDLDGLESVRSAPVPIAVDRVRPSAATGLRVERTSFSVEPNGRVRYDVTYDEVLDGGGIAESRVWVNGQLATTSSAPRESASTGRIRQEVVLPPGSFWIQVSTVDGAGNASVRTPPVRVDVPSDPGPPPQVPLPEAPGRVAPPFAARVAVSGSLSGGEVSTTVHFTRPVVGQSGARHPVGYVLEIDGRELDDAEVRTVRLGSTDLRRRREPYGVVLEFSCRGCGPGGHELVLRTVAADGRVSEPSAPVRFSIT